MSGLLTMAAIKSVIFDWGGVLIDDPGPVMIQYCADALNANRQDYAKVHNEFAADLRRGAISEDIFWAGVCSELNIPRPNSCSLWTEAFKAVYRPKAGMFSLVGRLRKNGYKTALLSNTEEPAVQYFCQQGYDMFDVLVFSCAEGIKKPERKIYELALDKLGVKAADAVFIDDKESCIKGAGQMGLNTILFKDIEQVNNELVRLGVKTD